MNEDLLERPSPGYSRYYRAFDVAQELSEPFRAAAGTVTTYAVTWSRPSEVAAFVRMAASSTQVQRGWQRTGRSSWTRCGALAAAAAHDGVVDAAYHSEVYLARRPG